MLKTTRLSNKQAFSKNNSSRLASNRNDNSRSTFKKNNGNSEVNGFDIGGNDVEHTKKSKKLSKSGKSKSIITSKS